MKKLISVLLLVTILCCGCGKTTDIQTTSTKQPANKGQETATKTQQSNQVTTKATNNPLNDNSDTTPIMSYSGTGDDVTGNLKLPASSMYYAKITSSGKGHFSVKGHYGNAYDLMVNTIDEYSGTVPLTSGSSYYFEINANSSWTIDIIKLGTSSVDSFNGNGDTVTPMFLSSSNAYVISAPNNSNHFSVKGYYGTGIGDYELLVNTTSVYNGTVLLKQKGKYCYFVINAECDWTISPK